MHRTGHARLLFAPVPPPKMDSIKPGRISELNGASGMLLVGHFTCPTGFNTGQSGATAINLTSMAEHANTTRGRANVGLMLQFHDVRDNRYIARAASRRFLLDHSYQDAHGALIFSIAVLSGQLASEADKKELLVLKAKEEIESIMSDPIAEVPQERRRNIVVIVRKGGNAYQVVERTASMRVPTRVPKKSERQNSVEFRAFFELQDQYNFVGCRLPDDDRTHILKDHRKGHTAHRLHIALHLTDGERALSNADLLVMANEELSPLPDDAFSLLDRLQEPAQRRDTHFGGMTSLECSRRQIASAKRMYVPHR